MKKSFIVFGILLLAIFVYAQQLKSADMNEFRANIATQKTEAKAEIKPYRFDGSKVTYFNFKTYKQVKEIEVVLFAGADYRFSFNGKSLPNDIRIEIYDKDKTEDERTKLHEFSGLQTKSVILESSDLDKTYKEKKATVKRLEKIFINYKIPAVPGAKNEEPTLKERGAVILVTGYKH